MTLTVFTPTYNRSEYLSRIFESLSIQKYTDFEWLIVDDGSTDGTNIVINQFKSHASFPIRYIYKSNGGKHTAINIAAKESRGEFMLWLDSDDWILPDSLEKLHHYLSQAKLDPNVSAVAAIRLNNNKKPLGSYIPNQPIDVNFWEFVQKNNIEGDYSWAIKTSILKKYPFPIYENENFCPEGLVLNRISIDYKTKFVPMSVIIGGYIQGGLTAQIRKLTQKNPLGFINYYKEIIESPQSKLKNKMKYAVLYWNQMYKTKGIVPHHLLPNKFLNYMRVPSLVIVYMWHFIRTLRNN